MMMMMMVMMMRRRRRAMTILLLQLILNAFVFAYVWEHSPLQFLYTWPRGQLKLFRPVDRNLVR